MRAILQQHPRVSCVVTITAVVPLRLQFVAADLPGLDVTKFCGAQAGEACVPGGRGAPVRLLLPGGCPMGACAAGPTLPARCPQIPGEYSVSGASHLHLLWTATRDMGACLALYIFVVCLV